MQFELKIKTFCLLLSVFVTDRIHSQDIILMANGREIKCDIQQIDSTSISYYSLKKVKHIDKELIKRVERDSVCMKNEQIIQQMVDVDEINVDAPYLPFRERNTKLKIISLDNVFSITKRNIQPFNPYQDSLTIQTNEEIIYKQDTLYRKFVLPVSDMQAWVMGRRSARKNFHSEWSTWGGVVTGLAGGLSLNYFFSYIPAVVYTATNGAIKPKAKHFGPEDAPYQNNEYFIEGYRMQAAKLKLKNSVIGAVPSLLAGVLIKYYLIP